MKTYIAINGSPRKNGNTAQLLDKALAGAKACHEDVDIQRIDLYDLSYTGCRSCFACKLKNGASYGKCAVKDDLQPVLEKVLKSNGVILGSPIYFRNITGQLHAFYERLFFPYTVYSLDRSGIEEKHIPFAFIYTMNVKEDTYIKDRYTDSFGFWENFMAKRLGRSCGSVCAFNTYQFSDYDKYVSDIFSEQAKREYRDTHWQHDLQAAYELGKTLAQ